MKTSLELYAMTADNIEDEMDDFVKKGLWPGHSRPTPIVLQHKFTQIPVG